MQLDTTEDDKLLTDPQVCADLNISPMTLWRWERDPDLAFPPKIKIRNRNYRSARAYREFKQRLMRRAIAGEAA
jgi:predicted DNA-binding transcriptional regulator AlpA